MNGHRLIQAHASDTSGSCPAGHCRTEPEGRGHFSTRSRAYFVTLSALVRDAPTTTKRWPANARPKQAHPLPDPDTVFVLCRPSLAEAEGVQPGRSRGLSPTRGLKNRPTEDVRKVSIPPYLVTVLREHLATFGTADDGRLFFSEKVSVVPSSTCYRVWQEARLLALPPAVRPPALGSVDVAQGRRRPDRGGRARRQQRRGPADPLRGVPGWMTGRRQPAHRGATPRVRVSPRSMPEATGAIQGPHCADVVHHYVVGVTANRCPGIRLVRSQPC